MVVLGNNDGCVVARSPEAKALGLGLGDTYFKIRHAFARSQGVAFSSNYRLYGDMSRRVMDTLRTFNDEIEEYPIDEAFLVISDPLPDLSSRALTLRSYRKAVDGTDRISRAGGDQNAGQTIQSRSQKRVWRDQSH